MSGWVNACVRACLVCLCVHTHAHLSVCVCACLVCSCVHTVVAGQCALSALPVCRNVLNWEGV